jgi:hypothetical protein
VIATFVSVDKVVKEERNVTLLQITAVAKLVRDFGRDVPRPALCGIEGNNPHWVFILACEQTNRHRFQISGLEVGLWPDAANLSEIIGYQVNRMIVTIRDNRRRPIPVHDLNSQRNMPSGFQIPP